MRIVALGLVAVTTLVALAVPVAAERGDVLDRVRSSNAAQPAAEQARDAAEAWLADAGYGDLGVADLVDVDGRFYVIVGTSTGDAAFELLVSRNGSWVHPAPTMMWNTSYDLMKGMMPEMPHAGMNPCTMNGDHQHGQHGGMMGSGGMNGMMDRDRMMDPAACLGIMGVAQPEPLDQPLTLDAAAAAAQSWLDANQPGAVATDPVVFPGYATMRVADGGTVTGLIAVQFTTGTVWPLAWPAS
jgi:hypothetical protein